MTTKQSKEEILSNLVENLNDQFIGALDDAELILKKTNEFLAKVDPEAFFGEEKESYDSIVKMRDGIEKSLANLKKNPYIKYLREE